ncbi:hypothetical protein BKA82DRAFT_4021442 [Pisolithus tinctorius]|nr:hypothetical protein BKA82DRAFT_4021442 [Pisolithus tinctorius]
MWEWCPWKAAVQRVLGIPHPLNTDGQKAGNSVINAKYTKGGACEIWVAQISSDSCQNGVHGKPLLSGCQGYLIRSIQMGGRLEILVRSGTGLGCPNQLRFMLEWCPWKAAVERVLRIPHPLNTNGRKAGNSVINGTYTPGAAYGRKAGNSLINGTYIQGEAYGRKAGNSLINGTYIQGEACELRFMPEWCPWKAAVERVLRIPHPLNLDVQKAGNSVINGTYTPEWCPCKATVEGVPGMPHPLNVDGWMAGNSIINAKYTKGAACEVWVTQISSNSCQNGFHGKSLLSRSQGCCIRSIQMGGWLAIV